MTTHIGKIARLARRRREEVSRRLDDGMPGAEILKWLNQLKDVQRLLRAQFGGRAVNKQNLSAWRRSGHVEWLQGEAAGRRAERLVTKAEALAKRAGKRGLGDRLAMLLALEMDGLMETWLKPETDPEKRWERVRALHREVSRLRRDDDRVKRTGLREAQVQGLKSKAQSRKQVEADWECKQAGEGCEDPPSQGSGAASEGVVAGQDESRQVKEVHEDKWLEHLKIEGPSPRVVERLPSLPGYEHVRVYEKGTGFWFMEKPAGWEPVGWKSSIMLERMKNEGLEVESLETGEGEGEGRGIIGRGIKNEELRMKNGEAVEPPKEAPYVPNADPEQEAYIQWWLMNRNFKPFDYEELQRLYAAIPKEEARSQESEAGMNAEAQRGEDTAELTTECVEGSEI